MSVTFFMELKIPEPEANLSVDSGMQVEQTDGIIPGHVKLLMVQEPYLCIVVSDGTSTMTCAITARKMLVRVAHVVGTIQSGDMTIHEEVIRIVTNRNTDYFFTT